MAATRLKLFVSSVQTELSEVRRALKAFLLGDAVLSRFVAEVFLFEDLSARDQRADEVYLSEVDRCDVYLGIFGYDYGNRDTIGFSPTEREYNRATERGKPRLIYVWGSDEERRHPAMKQLIRRASGELVRRRVDDMNSLNAAVYSSLVDMLDGRGDLRVPPFDTAVSEGATLKQISTERIDWFLNTARRERGFPLKANTEKRALLTHLNLLEKGQPNNAAVLLFGVAPQKFHRTAEIKCVHCHGTEYRRPFASHQIYSGDLFEQADQARDFVLSKINRGVGRRTDSAIAPAEYELPPDAVGEAIVNAIAHRDYNGNGSVEVRLFPDRLEVWNPGTLPNTLTVDDLRKDHPSIPNNPLLAETLYLARYIEKAGSGTQAMIDECNRAGLPEPDFEQHRGWFVVKIWRDWLTEETLARLDLNDRQRTAVGYLKVHGRISNAEYQQLTKSTRKTALRDIGEMKLQGIIRQIGSRGAGVHYVLCPKNGT